jgi:hypothetical protein
MRNPKGLSERTTNAKRNKRQAYLGSRREFWAHDQPPPPVEGGGACIRQS